MIPSKALNLKDYLKKENNFKRRDVLKIEINKWGFKIIL